MKKGKKNYSAFKNILYVYKEGQKRNKKLVFYLLFNLISAVITPLLGVILSPLVVWSLTNSYEPTKYIIIIVIMSLLMFMFSAIETTTRTRYTWENTFTRCSGFWTNLTENNLSIDYLNFEPKEKQKICNKAFEAISSNWVGIEGMMKQAPVLIINLVNVIIYSVLIIYYIPYVMIILVVMSVVNFLLVRRANKYLEKMRDPINDEYRENDYLNALATNVNHGKDIRLYRLNDWFDRLFVTLTKRSVKLTSKINKKFLYANLSDSIFLAIRDISCYIFLIVMVINGKIDVTTFTFLIGIVAGFSNFVNGFLLNLNNVRRYNIQVNEYRECLNMTNVFKHEGGLTMNDISTPITIEFKNVTFRYTDDDKDTISNLSFKINANERVAIVGNNGAGKTTIIKLLCGLYTPNSGEILINNHNVLEFNTYEYMKLLSVVFQDSEPLALSIANNITCSMKKDVDYDKLWDSLDKAGLKEKVELLPNKENTYITQMYDESGIRLSGGETQKLMLARALYKNAPLLILDEPTAALDPISEEKMYLTYLSLTGDFAHTSLFISHRLSSTKFCDRILFLEHGQVVESGTHDELIKLGGKYKEIFNIQSKYYVEGEKDNEETTL